MTSWLAARRRPPLRPEDFGRHLHPAQTRGRALRMTEWLRDRLRSRWLHVRRENDDNPE